MPQLMIVTLLATVFQVTLKDDDTTTILGQKVYTLEEQKTEEDLKREAAEEWKKPLEKISISDQSKFSQ